MKERPILFQGAMVRALLPGLKTQTRRVVKPQLLSGQHQIADVIATPDSLAAFVRQRCPYGQPGDRLWVRESWGYFDPDGGNQEFNEDGPASSFRDELMQEGHALRDYWRRRIAYAASWQEPRYGNGPAAPKRWRPSIHMPRWASRVLLEVASVRVERLNAISAEDATAEGWPGPDALNSISSAYPIAWYSYLWESINGADSWDANPWVWVVEFKRAEVS